MLTIVACDADGRLEEGVSKDRLAALLKSRHVTVWVDLSGPTGEESDLLTSIFHFHPLALEDCEMRRHHPKIDDYGSYLFILSHGVHPESSAREFRTRQLSIFLGPNYLVTYHREASRSIQSTLESVRKNHRLMADGPGMILYRVLDFQIDLYLPLMEVFQKRIDEIEKECFAAPTSAILQEVFDLRKALVRLRRFSGHQREILLRLSRREFPLIDDRSAVHLRDVYDHLVRITDLAESYRELVAGAFEAHLSIVSNRTNEIMRALTIITTLFMPLTLIAGIYGMNFPDMPEFHWKRGYLFAYILMAAVAAGMYYLFRRRGIFRRPGR
jgi:magnesium transporter